MLQHFDVEYLYFSAVIMLCLRSAEVKPLGYCEENIVLDGFVATETAGNILDVTEKGWNILKCLQKYPLVWLKRPSSPPAGVKVIRDVFKQQVRFHSMCLTDSAYDRPDSLSCSVCSTALSLSILLGRDAARRSRIILGGWGVVGVPPCVKALRGEQMRKRRQDEQ